MHMTRLVFAVLLLIVSLFSIPKLNLLDLIINFSTAETTVVSINADNDIVDANPRMKKIQAEIYKFVDSIDSQIWPNLIWLELLFVSLGGIYIALSMFRHKAASKYFLITICLVFLFTQGAPWDVSDLFKGVNSYASLVSRLKLSWEYDSAIHWLVTSCLFGTFYLITAVISVAQFFSRKPPKVF
jgi:hypothetical protein